MRPPESRHALRAEGVSTSIESPREAIGPARPFVTSVVVQSRPLYWSMRGRCPMAAARGGSAEGVRGELCRRAGRPSVARRGAGPRRRRVRTWPSRLAEDAIGPGRPVGLPSTGRPCHCTDPWTGGAQRCVSAIHRQTPGLANWAVGTTRPVVPATRGEPLVTVEAGTCSARSRWRAEALAMRLST